MQFSELPNNTAGIIITNSVATTELSNIFNTNNTKSNNFGSTINLDAAGTVILKLGIQSFRIHSFMATVKKDLIHCL